jgi:hypothetical protein
MAVKTVQQWLQSFGLQYIANDPYSSYYANIAAGNIPAGAPSTTANLIEACLRARGVLYYKNKPGDCGAPSKVNPSKVKTAIQLSESSLGAVSALSSAGIIGLGAGTAVLGAATFGIGLAAAPILAIVQHHQQAVATEQSDLCSVSQAANQAIPQIDQLVISGQADPHAAADLMESVCLNLKQGLDSIKKKCNAACIYEGVLQAHVDFARKVYPLLSPIKTSIAPTGVSSQTVASASTAIKDNVSPYAPVGVQDNASPTSSHALSANISAQYPTQFQASTAASVMPVPSNGPSANWFELLLAAAALIIVIFAVKG